MVLLWFNVSVCLVVEEGFEQSVPMIILKELVLFKLWERKTGKVPMMILEGVVSLWEGMGGKV